MHLICIIFSFICIASHVKRNNSNDKVMNIFPDLKMMASMGVDAEAEMEELFAQDEAEEPPGTQSLTQEEGIHLKLVSQVSTLIILLRIYKKN